jgi:hypothetical protein
MEKVRRQREFAPRAQTKRNWSLRQAALALARHTPASPVGATGPLILRRSCRLWLIGARFFMFVLKKRRWPDISTFRKRANALSSKSPNSR